MFDTLWMCILYDIFDMLSVKCFKPVLYTWAGFWFFTAHTSSFTSFFSLYHLFHLVFCQPFFSLATIQVFSILQSAFLFLSLHFSLESLCFVSLNYTNKRLKRIFSVFDSLLCYPLIYYPSLFPHSFLPHPLTPYSFLPNPSSPTPQPFSFSAVPHPSSIIPQSILHLLL